MRRLMVVTALLAGLAWSGAAFAVVDETTDIPTTNDGKPIQEGELKIKTESGKVIAQGRISHGNAHKIHVHNDDPKASRDDKVVIEIYDKRTNKTYEHDRTLAAVVSSGIDAASGGPAVATRTAPVRSTVATRQPVQPVAAEIPALRKMHFSLIGGGAYLNAIDVNSSSGFFAGSTQSGAVATLWGGSVFVDVMRIPFVGYAPMLSVGVVADQVNAQFQFTGLCGGSPCSGTNGSLSETAVIGEVNFAWPLGGGNVFNYYVGGGVVFKAPRGNPTGAGGPAIEGSDTAAAWRMGATLMHDFSDSVAAGFKVGYQSAGSTSFNTSMPGERFHFGRENELIFAAVATFSIPVPGAPPP